MDNLNLNLNTARAPNNKHNSPEVKEVCYFAEESRYIANVKPYHLRIAMHYAKIKYTYQE
jgi:hypothetical protein